MDIDLSFAAAFSTMTGKEKKLRIARKTYLIIEAFGSSVSKDKNFDTYQYVGSNLVITYSKFYSNNKQIGRSVIISDKNDFEKKYYVAKTKDYYTLEAEVTYIPGDWERELEEVYKSAYLTSFNQAKSMLETASDQEKSLWGRFYITNDFEVNVDIEYYIDELMKENDSTGDEESYKIITLGEGIYAMSNQTVKQVIVVDGLDARVVYCSKFSDTKSVPGYWTGRFGELAEAYLEKRKVSTIESSEHGSKKLVCIENKSE